MQLGVDSIFDTAAAASFLATPMQPMPRLKTFLVKKTSRRPALRQFDQCPTALAVALCGHATEHWWWALLPFQERAKRKTLSTLSVHWTACIDASSFVRPANFLFVPHGGTGRFGTSPRRKIQQLEHVELVACGPRTLDAVVALNTTRRHQSQLLVSVRKHLNSMHYGLTDPTLAAGIYGVVRLSSMAHSSFVPFAAAEDGQQAPTVDAAII
jgi:hypothetical protein